MLRFEIGLSHVKSLKSGLAAASIQKKNGLSQNNPAIVTSGQGDSKDLPYIQ